MRLATTVFVVLLAGSCVSPTMTAADWEYRVLPGHEYYGLASAEEFAEIVTKGDWWPVLIAAKQRWAAEGWDIAPESIGEARVFLRRNRTHPQPFEVQLIKKKEFAELPAEVASTRINDLALDGWQLVTNNAMVLEFQRPL